MAAQALETRRIAQKLHDFLHVFLGFVATGHIGKAHFIGRIVKHARLALSERESARLAALHLTHEENPHADQKQHREPAHKNRLQERRFFFGLAEDLHAVFTQIVNHPQVARAGDHVGSAFDGRHRDLAALHVHAANLAVLGVLHELRVARLLGIHGRCGRVVKLPEDGKEHKCDEQPDRHAADHSVVQDIPLSCADGLAVQGRPVSNT